MIDTVLSRLAAALRLPRSVLVLQAGRLVNAFGGGTVLPFLTIYLVAVKDLAAAQAGLAIGLMNLSAFLYAPFAGRSIDSSGPKRVAGFALLTLSITYLLIPRVTGFWAVSALLAVAGAATGANRPAQSSLLVALTPQQQRHSAFALAQVASNLGIGLGSVVGGVVAAGGGDQGLDLVMYGNALTYLALLGTLLAVKDGSSTNHQPVAGYATLVRDTTYTLVLLYNALLFAAGFSVFMTALPLYAVQHQGLDELQLGLVFGANTAAIVAAQLPITRRLEGRPRAHAMLQLSLLWAGAWLLALYGPELVGIPLFAVFIGVAVVFAMGECLYDAVVEPLAAAMAPEAEVGRYMAALSLSRQVGSAGGPLLATVLLAVSSAMLWWAAAATCLSCGVLAIYLGRRLKPGVRYTPK